MIETPFSRKVLLLGQPRSGTTALFFAVKEAMPSGTRGLFEPRQYVPEEGDAGAGVLAKVLTHLRVDHASFLAFDKKVLIARDPRDQSVSELLYLPYELYYNDPKGLERFMTLLAQKEEDPLSVPARALWEAHIPAGRLEALLRLRIQKFYDAERFFAPVFVVKYEDFVDGKMKPLEDFLGVSLSNKVRVDPRLMRVARTRSYGAWRHWFTEEDRKFFEPIWGGFMDRYGYEKNWDLAKDPKIEKEQSSEYALRIVNERRERMGLGPARWAGRYGSDPGLNYMDADIPGFDWKFYVDHHPDLQRAGVDTKEKAEAHYVKFGRKERRRIKA